MTDSIPRHGRHRPQVVVVGGGIAGLAAAHRLARLEPLVDVTLIEAEGRLGGKILTERVDGFVIEGGPDSFLSAKPRGVGLCQELGLADRLQGTIPRRRRAYVLRDGRLHDLPEGLTGLVPTRLGPILRTGLLSPAGKARLAFDYLLPPRRRAGDESLAGFVRRRLGGEAYERLIEPLMAGIYAGDGERLSLAATFPQLRQGELAHGGLIKGALAAKRRTGNNGAPRPGFVTPRGGLDEVVDALVGRLRAAGGRILPGQPATGLMAVEEPDGSRYEVTMAGGETVRADALVLATPAFAAADLVDGLDAELSAELRAIPHASSAIVTLAYARGEVPHRLDGYGYVIPRNEGRSALACTWSSAKWAHRAPEGYALLRVFVGRFGREEALAGSDHDLIALAAAEVRETLGIVVAPLVVRVHRWPCGMPQYTVGHLQRLAVIERRLTAHPGLTLAGHAYRGVGLPDCIASGEAAADAVHSFVVARRPAGSASRGERAVAAG